MCSSIAINCRPHAAIHRTLQNIPKPRNTDSEIKNFVYQFSNLILLNFLHFIVQVGNGFSSLFGL